MASGHAPSSLLQENAPAPRDGHLKPPSASRNNNAAKTTGDAASAVGSVPLVRRIGSLMAATLGKGWPSSSSSTAMGPSMASAGGKAPMMDPIVDGTGRLCINNDTAMEAMAAQVVKPGGLLDSLLRSGPGGSGQARAETQDFIAQLIHQAAVPEVAGSLDGVRGNGRTMMVVFDGLFTHTITIPSGFATSHANNLLPGVKMTGASMVSFPVNVDPSDEGLTFGQGWLDFVAAEKVVLGDQGLFVLTANNTMEMYLYDAKGDEKPMSKRPVVWDLFIAYGDEFNPRAATPPPMPEPEEEEPEPGMQANHFIVPENVRGMRYSLGPRLFISEPIVERLAHVWINYRPDYPLYAFTMIKSHMTSGVLYFTTGFSELLPYMPRDVKLYYSSNPEYISGKLKKRYGDGLARVTKGWRTFVQENYIEQDEILVLCIKNTRAGLNIHAFPVAMA